VTAAPEDILLTDTQWAAIQALDGQELLTRGIGTLRSRRPFTVRKQSALYIEAVPSSGSPRPIGRRDFDRALGFGVAIDDLRPSMLQQLMQTSSYVVAILQELHRRGLV
jgi:hypothetical protein